MKRLIIISFIVMFSFCASFCDACEVRYAMVYYTVPLNIDTYGAFENENSVKKCIFTERTKIRGSRQSSLILKKVNDYLKCRDSIMGTRMLDLRVVIEFYDRKDKLIDSCGFDGGGRLQYKGISYGRNDKLVRLIEDNVIGLEMNNYRRMEF